MTSSHLLQVVKSEIQLPSSLCAATTEYHGWVTYKQQKILCHSVGAPFQDQMSDEQIQCLVRTSSVLQMAVFLKTYGTGGEKALCGIFYKGTNPIYKGSTLRIQSYPKIPSHWGLGLILSYELQWTHLVYNNS